MLAPVKYKKTIDDSTLEQKSKTYPSTSLLFTIVNQSGYIYKESRISMMMTNKENKQAIIESKPIKINYYVANNEDYSKKLEETYNTIKNYNVNGIKISTSITTDHLYNILNLVVDNPVITELHIASNRITNEILQKIINIPQLYTLILEDCSEITNIEEIILKNISSTSNLSKLVLHKLHCLISIKQLNCQYLSNLNELRLIDCHNLESLDPEQNIFSRLQTIEFNNCIRLADITGLNKYSFKGLKIITLNNLTNYHVNIKDISILTDKKFINLEKLTINGYNDIGKLTEVLQSYTLKNLTYLDLNDNNLHDLTSLSAAKFLNIKTIKFNNKKNTSIALDIFSNLKNLELGNCYNLTLECIEKLPQLRYIRLKGNYKDLSDAIKKKYFNKIKVDYIAGPQLGMGLPCASYI